MDVLIHNSANKGLSSIFPSFPVFPKNFSFKQPVCKNICKHKVNVGVGVIVSA